jgi:hypothetical protein
MMRDMRRQFLQLLEGIGFVVRGGQVCTYTHTHTHTQDTHTRVLMLETYSVLRTEVTRTRPPRSRTAKSASGCLGR